MTVFTNRQTIMISDVQKESLHILKSYNVNVSAFIRDAIKEKIKQDWKEIRKPKNNCHF